MPAFGDNPDGPTQWDSLREAKEAAAWATKVFGQPYEAIIVPTDSRFRKGRIGEGAIIRATPEVNELLDLEHQ